MSDERATAAVPIAVDLIAAVQSFDPYAVEAVLKSITDWPALAVVLANRASDATGEALTTRVLNDLRDGDLSVWQVANRYGLTAKTVRNLAANNRVRIVEPDESLNAGRWVGRKGIHVWVSEVAS